MPLIYILNRMASDLGMSMNSAADLTFAIGKVNSIAKELYDSKDIKDCLREITVNVDSAEDSDPAYSSLVSLPYPVGEIRGFRYSQIVGGKLPVNDMTPRYHQGKGWGTNSAFLPLRMVRDMSPICREIANASELTLTLEEPQAVDVYVAFVGSTATAARKQEIVKITAGQLTGTVTSNFEEIDSIVKVEMNCTCDITITDADDYVLSVIPSCLQSPQYKLMELNDANASIAGTALVAGQMSAIDILFKHTFIPFQNMYDEFVCKDCDDVIYWMLAAWYESTIPGHEGRVKAAVMQADNLLNNILIDNETGVKLEAQFAPDRFVESMQPYRANVGLPWQFGR